MKSSEFKQYSQNEIYLESLEEYSYLFDEFINSPIKHIDYIENNRLFTTTHPCISIEFYSFHEGIQWFERYSENHIVLLYGVINYQGLIRFRFIGLELDKNYIPYENIIKRKKRVLKLKSIL